MDSQLNRRSFLRSLGITGGLGVLAAQTSCALGLPATAQAAQQTSERKPWYELGLMEDPIMDNQLLHYLAGTYSAQSDIGEVLETAQRILPGDPWNWTRQWVRTAERVRAMGSSSLAKGHAISAGKAYLRAANYYRAALIHHPDPKDPSVLETGRQAVASYNKALETLDVSAQPVRIPYEGTTLPGYYFRSQKRLGSSVPILIMHQGRDAWPEESKYIIDDALERGYHCLIFHGPGQGMAIREQKLAFRPDWERVVTPVVDFVSRIADVDKTRIALMGLSMGGALAPRAAAFDKRLKILIANPGVLNWGGAMFQQFNALFPQVMALLETNPEAFNAAMAQIMAKVPAYDWYLKDSMNKHGVNTPAQFMQALKAFNNEPVVNRISCRTLVMDSTNEGFSVGQAKLLFDALRCPKDYMLFNEQDTGLLHCQEGASAVANHRMFDWLEEHL